MAAIEGHSKLVVPSLPIGQIMIREVCYVLSRMHTTIHIHKQDFP